MDQPWLLVGSGVLFIAFGGVLAVASLSTETAELMWVAWGTGTLGSLVLFVGLIAMGVAIGVRSAER